MSDEIEGNSRPGVLRRQR